MSTTEPGGGAGSGPAGGVGGSGRVGALSGSGRVGGAEQRQPAQAWAAAYTSAEFAALRLRLRGFVFPMTAFFLAWYFLYVLLAAFAPRFMTIKVIGNINLGLIFGLLQFVSTFAITALYVRFANRNLDPISSRIRERVEGGAW